MKACAAICVETRVETRAGLHIQAVRRDGGGLRFGASVPDGRDEAEGFRFDTSMRTGQSPVSVLSLCTCVCTCVCPVSVPVCANVLSTHFTSRSPSPHPSLHPSLSRSLSLALSLPPIIYPRLCPCLSLISTVCAPVSVVPSLPPVSVALFPYQTTARKPMPAASTSTSANRQTTTSEPRRESIRYASAVTAARNARRLKRSWRVPRGFSARSPAR